jgi:hypothetical protein
MKADIRSGKIKRWNGEPVNMNFDYEVRSTIDGGFQAALIRHGAVLEIDVTEIHTGDSGDFVIDGTDYAATEEDTDARTPD